MLYTVNKSPLSANSLASVLRVAQYGSPILLYEDGVYAVLPGARSADTVAGSRSFRRSRPATCAPSEPLSGSTLAPDRFVMLALLLRQIGYQGGTSSAGPPHESHSGGGHP